MSIKEITWAGEQLHLYAARALFWPAAKTLFIADTHWGKEATFQHAGIPIPPGSSAKDLARLSALLTRTQAERLLILGDFFHTHSSRAPHILNDLRRWRALHSALEVILIKGNHDRHAGVPPDELHVLCVEEGYPLDPFICRHQPLEKAEVPQGCFILAGHLHPVFTLSDGAGSHLRLPCFHFGTQQAVLPAFASFSGGFNISPQKQERVYVTIEEQIYKVPSPSLNSR